jgi:FeS assembly SUF system protein
MNEDRPVSTPPSGDLPLSDQPVSDAPVSDPWDFDKAPAPMPGLDEPLGPNATQATPMPGSALSAEEIERLSHQLVGALKTVYDPEIPADIYELGLIYKIDVDDDRNVEIDMTLTAPGCPVAGEMPVWVENAVSAVEGVGQVKVNLVFDPPWTVERMSDEAKLALNMF